MDDIDFRADSSVMLPANQICQVAAEESSRRGTASTGPLQMHATGPGPRVLRASFAEWLGGPAVRCPAEVQRERYMGVSENRGP